MPEQDAPAQYQVPPAQLTIETFPASSALSGAPLPDPCLVLRVDLDPADQVAQLPAKNFYAILRCHAEHHPFGDYDLVGTNKRATGFHPNGALATRLYFEFTGFRFAAFTQGSHYFEVIVHAVVSTLDRRQVGKIRTDGEGAPHRGVTVVRLPFDAAASQLVALDR